MKTLVIEDSKSSLKLLCEHIRKLGITPIPAETGAIGIDLFLKERPDLVLLDIIMPDLDGYEVARQIRQLAIAHPGTPLAHVTASFGIASAVAMPETDPQDIVGAADLALYKAKHGGRNRICQTTSLDPQDN